MSSFLEEYGNILLALICVALILVLINPVISVVGIKIDAILSLLM